MKTHRCITAAALLCSLACGASREQSYAGTVSGTSAVDETLSAQAETLWGLREDPGKLRESLKLYEQIATKQPDDRPALIRLARGYYLLADGYLTDEPEILAAYHAGAGWGERVLGLRPEFLARLEQGVKDYEALDATTAQDAPGVYWAYANLGKWSVAKGFTTVLKNKTKLKAFIDRVAEVAPEYFHGAADRGLGAYYAKAPSFAGGDLAKAKQHFDKSLAIAPMYLGTKVLMAEYYAVKSQNRELFERLLNEVIAADPTGISDAVPMMKIEQRKAKVLLGQVEDLFE